METLQTMMEGWLEELPGVFLSELLNKKLRDQGIKLSKRKRRELAHNILRDHLDSFEIEHGANLDSNQDMVIEFTDEDLSYIDRCIENFRDHFPILLQQIAELALHAMKKQWRTESRRQRRDLDAVRKRLHDRWGDGLEKLRMLMTISREYGNSINKAVGTNGGGSCPKTFTILIKLHSRSCQVAEEVVCLLSNGFADGAIARWRTLQEIAAVAYLIQRHGDELAERYEHHEIVESRKAALQYQRYQKRLKQKPISRKMLRTIESGYKDIIDRYGNDFKNSYGWAAKHLGKGNPTIADIQEAIGIDHLAPYYRMASHNVHANPKGVFFKLGLMGEADILLTGPSNAGLADPGHATALSIVQISGLLLHLHPTLDNQVVVRAMQALEREIGGALLAAKKKLEADEKALKIDRTT